MYVYDQPQVRVGRDRVQRGPYRHDLHVTTFLVRCEYTEFLTTHFTVLELFIRWTVTLI